MYIIYDMCEFFNNNASLFFYIIDRVFIIFC